MHGCIPGTGRWERVGGIGTRPDRSGEAEEGETGARDRRRPTGLWVCSVRDDNLFLQVQ